MAAAWPTGANIDTWLSDRGFTALTAGVATAAIAEAKALFESLVGYSPFLSTGSLTTRYFDPPRQSASGILLALDMPLSSLNSGEIIINWNQVASTGTTLTQYTDWTFKDRNAAYQTHIRFLTGLTLSSYAGMGGPQSVKIRANWGHATVPDDVYYAVLELAAGIGVFNSQAGASGMIAMTEIRQGPVTYKFGDTGANFWKASADKFNAAVARYRWVAD